jgi:hypothetical protein
MRQFSEARSIFAQPLNDQETETEKQLILFENARQVNRAEEVALIQCEDSGIFQLSRIG